MKERLYPFHVAILIYMTQSGVVILSLPRLLAEEIGYNGWLFLLIASAFSALNIALIRAVYRVGGGRSIFDIMETSVSKILLFPLYVAMALVMAIIGSLAAKQYVLIYQMISFPTTHPMVFELVVVFLAYMLVLKGIYNLSKAVTVFFWIVVWMNLLLLFFFRDFEWARLTPYFFQEGKFTGEGVFSVYLAFMGYELSLFLFPYAEKKHFFKAVFSGHLLVTIMYMLICVVSFGFYSLNQLKHLLFPLLDMLSYIRFPFIERIENLLFGFFLIPAMLTVSNYLWAGTETLGRIFPKAKPGLLTGVLLLLSLFVSWWPEVLTEVEQWLTYAGYLQFLTAVLLPIFLLALLAFQHRKGAGQNA